MTQPQQQQPNPPADDNPRGAMPADSYATMDLDQLTPSERAAFEAAGEETKPDGQEEEPEQ